MKKFLAVLEFVFTVCFVLLVVYAITIFVFTL